jgi:hypothetical protein
MKRQKELEALQLAVFNAANPARYTIKDMRKALKALIKFKKENKQNNQVS